MLDLSTNRGGAVCQRPDPERDGRARAMAEAGQKLAVHWGHQPWSDSWAQLVADTLLKAAEDFEESLYWRCECGDLNRTHEAFCYRCGAGQPDDA